MDKDEQGRSSDLLLPSAGLPIKKQWQWMAGEILKITASGNVQDFHLIPFSLIPHPNWDGEIKPYSKSNLGRFFSLADFFLELGGQGNGPGPS